MKKRVLIAGGGTGGHIFPAIAIANAIKVLHPNTEFLFIGANGKIEMEKVPAAGFKIEGINISGFSRKKNLALPFKLMKTLFQIFFSLIKCFFIIRKFKPNVGVGVGGYASGPALQVAKMLSVPYLIQEQNSLPGVTNRLLGSGASIVCVCYKNMQKYFAAEKIRITGNPIRASILDIDISKEDAAKEFKLSANLPTVFITGGSLGASAINKAIAKQIEKLIEKGIQVIWQCGKIYFEEYKKYSTDKIIVTDFVKRMDAAYKLADVIVSRAGGTIAELAVVGKPTILLPSPNVAEDHQTKNVEALVDEEASVLIKDVNAEKELVPKILALLNNEEEKAKLSKNIKQLAKTDSATEIAKLVMSIAK